MRARLALLLLAAPLAFAPAASAAGPTVPGCWGAGDNTYCDATVRVAGASTGSNPTPVCAGSCVYVGVPSAQVDDVLTFAVCLDHRTASGSARSTCAGDVDQILEDNRIDVEQIRRDVPKVPGVLLCRLRGGSQTECQIDPGP
ncbi:MAG TPA: hypothetical protein VF519_11510 [Mycobacteriales bacterium]